MIYADRILRNSQAAKRIVIGGCLLVICCGAPGKAQHHFSAAGYSAQLTRGQQAMQAQEWDKAVSCFRNALAWNHNGVEAHLGLAAAYRKEGKSQQAREEYEAVLRLNPHNAEAERGAHRVRSKDEEEQAFTALAERVSHEPKNANLHTTFAEELLERDRVEEAQKEAEIALRLDAKQGHAYCVLGRIAAQRGKDEEARKNLKIAVSRDRTDDDAFITLGDLAMRAKDYKQAIVYYQRAVSIVPEESEGHKRLAEALMAAGDTKKAEQEKAIGERLGSK